MEYAGFQLDINYGCSKLRFPAPVLVGSKLRATLEVLGIEACCLDLAVGDVRRAGDGPDRAAS